jgi:L-amino acid N-acyltransferase YncA
MKIRPAESRDASSIAHVHVESWRTTYADILPRDFLAKLSTTSREQYWRTTLTDDLDNHVIFVAENDEKEIVGFAHGGPERAENAPHLAELYAIYLLKTAERKGIGRGLVEHVAQGLADKGFKSMLAWVLQDNPYKPFYEKLGGISLKQQEIFIAEQSLTETAYHWPDISKLVKSAAKD